MSNSYPAISNQIARVCIVVLLAISGCTNENVIRPARTQEQLLAARDAQDRKFDENINALMDRNIRRIKADYDNYTAGRTPAPPVVNFLILSGGGDWGAFGAGYLIGWGAVPAGPMARPTFDTVTGVSTGALIAPFAFLGDDESLHTIEDLYRHPPADLMKPIGLLSLLQGGASYAQAPGLERVMRESLNMQRIQRIAQLGASGRILAVNATNIDTGEMHFWNLIAEAQQAVETKKDDRLQQVLLASAAIPGIFPPRLIDDALYVDGGVTGNVLFSGRRLRGDSDTFPGRWQTIYPGAPIPKIRYWVILNNQVRAAPELVQPRWSSVLLRSSSASIRASTLTSVRQLMLQAQVARLRYGADVEVRYVAMPDGWTAPKPGNFVPESMNALADLGRKMGADPNSWMTEAP